MLTLDQNEKKDRRCVWMTAGLIRYKLCDRDFDCENCPFHHVMRGQTAASESGETLAVVESYLNHLFNDCSIHPDRFTESGHLWLKKTGARQVRAGMDPFYRRILEPLNDVAIPTNGQVLRPGQLAVLAVRDDLAVPFYCPFGGVVFNACSANEALEENDNGGLFSLHIDDQTARFMDNSPPNASLSQYERIVSELRAFLIPAIQEQRPGITLPDGGLPECDLRRVLGEKNYRRLLKSLFNNTFL